MEQLLTTKLFIPSIRPELVPRPRLIDQLNAGLHHKLTLISAPAGFGKTTLISEWAGSLISGIGEENQINYWIAWLSLDERDNDPTRFLTYLIAALNRVEEIEVPLGEGALSMLQSSPQPPVDSVLISLINEIAALQQKIILVLDDFHLIKDQPSHEALTILLLQALAFQAEDNTALAMKPLEHALTLAEPRGYVRIFVDEGSPMSGLLYEALSRGIAPEYVQRLLAGFPVDEPQQATSTQSQTPEYELVEPLSERELEILQLIAEGLTNPEIATRLYLSPNTVKVHTRNIYGKLGVNNRTQAVARARALGVFPSTWSSSLLINSLETYDLTEIGGLVKNGSFFDVSWHNNKASDMILTPLINTFGV